MGTLRIPYLLQTFLLSISLLLSLTHLTAAASDPGISRTSFPNPLNEVQYFDDSDVVLVTDERLDRDSKVWRSTDAGTSWDPIEELPEGQIAALLMNPHDKQVALALSIGSKHWITRDRGQKWHEFEMPDEAIPSFRSAPLVSWHATDSERIILNTRTRRKAQAVYTTDGFDSVKVLKEDALRCLWVKEQPLFTTGKEDTDRNRVLCVAGGRYSADTEKQRLLMSDEFFKDDGVEPELEPPRAVQGIVSVVAARGFVLAARQSAGTAEMALYVTTDTKTWHRANFGEHQLKEGGYTIMDSTNYSLQVDVRTGSFNAPPMGALYTSNSQGYNFVKNEEATNRNEIGFVDFEKVTNIQGIVLVNIVDNKEEVERTDVLKKLVSQISFDDGRTFHDLKCDGKTLHLHSVTDASNVGSIFSSPAPGMLMGVGNTGRDLREYPEGDLYVSDDAGRTWSRALGGPHKYEFGDQGSVLVAVWDGGEMDKISYSLNHGKKWQPVWMKDAGLEDDAKFRVRSLTTHPDSTSLKFIMKATVGVGRDQKNYLYSIDFNKLDKKECKDDDFERWNAVEDEDGKPACIMGHKQSFRRRKAHADCFVGDKFRDPEPRYDSEGCVCTIKDFECEAGFKRSENRKSCIPERPIEPQSGQCKGDDKKFKATNGFRKIPGNQCEEDKENPIAGDTEYDCDFKAGPKDGEIAVEWTRFDTNIFREAYYLERSGSSDGDDETIVARTDEGHQVWITHDHGKKWMRILEDEKIGAIYPHRHFNDRVYFLGPSDRVFYSANRGLKKPLDYFKIPGPPAQVDPPVPILRFHPSQEDWLIWTSCAEGSRDCLTQSHVTVKHGASWDPMLRAVRDCEFAWREARDASVKQELVYCVQHKNDDMMAPKRLVSSDDFFKTKEPRFEAVMNFATMSEYIVVASESERDSKYLKIDSSIDGKSFADARFPSNLQNDTSTAYTVLDSSTHSIFLHVTVNDKLDHQYGTIIKSNSNGTSYALSLQNVNRNRVGYVDFEKLMSMDGVAIANVVANVEEVDKDRADKKLQTRITHNDGSQWDSIRAPEKDAEGKKYDCDANDPKKCALHLHGYTERVDPRDTYASASAIGFMLGVGNVGEYLGPKRDGNTFVSSDGGITWRTAKNGQYMWEFGDQGGIIVIVAEDRATDVVFYSLDEGLTWREFKFSDSEIPIHDITTVPSDTSMNFLLWGTGRDKAAVTINLDFSGLATRKCDVPNPESKTIPSDSDYTIFEPKHPFQSNNCLFGHRWQYLRKKPGVRCYNGPLLPDGGLWHKEEERCECTRSDYECAYNHERNKDGQCVLVPGLTHITKEDWCAQNPKADTFYPEAAYRRIPLTTCKDGDSLDEGGRPEACPGKEKQFQEKHGISGAGLFFAIVLPIAAAAGIGYYLYQRFEGNLGMGRIRLGGDAGGLSINAHRPSIGGDWTKYPVMLVSGAAAVVLAVPMVIGIVWNRVREWTPWRSRGSASYRPYTSRGNFSRGRRDYTPVGGQDESDLLGDESDDDV